MDAITIHQNVTEILKSLPPGVSLLAAAKTRSPEELRAVVEAGVTHLGHNYVQEGEASVQAVGREPGGVRLHWHLIGHLQRNKAKKALSVFDWVDTVDSLRLGQALEGVCSAEGKVLPVLIEVNSASEPNKSGVLPEAVEELVRGLAGLPHLRVAGLMTMGPFTGEADLQRAFCLTRRLYEELGRAAIPNVSLEVLSMGMSDSYRLAIQEGATQVRIGTALFGPR